MVVMLIDVRKIAASDSRTMRSCLPVMVLATLCIAASANAQTYTLIVGPRTELGPLAGVPANISYTPVSITSGDLNGDGATDIVLGLNGTGPAVYFNNGTANPFENVLGVFASPPNSSMSSWGAAVIADVNLDDRPDLAIAGFNAPNMIYLNDGTATPFNGVAGIAIGTQDVSSVPALGDVNGDSFPDLAIASTNHEPSRLYLTQGAPLTSGSYTTVQVGTDLGYGQDAEIADVNGDGRADLILTYGHFGAAPDPSGIAIYLNDGVGDPFGGVTPLRLLTGSHYVNTVAIADFNNDGRPDLAAALSDASVEAQSSVVFLNTASSTQPFSGSQTLQLNTNVGGGCLGIAAGDVNGDARPDLLFSCLAPPWDASPAPENPAVGAIYLNNGTANPFVNVSPVDVPATQFSGYGRSVGLGTFVANGRPAVLIVDEGTGSYYPTVLAEDPVAQNDSLVVATNASFSIAVLANDSAAPGQSLDAGSVRITAAPRHGTANVNSNGSVTYLPAAGYTGVDDFQYTVRDGLGAASHAATVSITVQAAPVAANDLVTLTANQSVTLNVLGNDTSTGGTLNAASIHIVVAPIHGTAVVTNGQVVYTPAQGYTGVDAFQYSVQDNLGTVSNTATASLSVQPVPVAGNDTASVAANQSVTIDVLTNDRSDGGTLNTGSISIAVAPLHGTAAVTSGQIIYTPTNGYSGGDSFQYSVRDNLGAASNAATVTIAVAAPPSSSSGGSGSGGGGSMRFRDVFALAVLVLVQLVMRRRRIVLSSAPDCRC
jgi:hypothetical protein